MANVSYPVLVTTAYVAPGAYIGQLITPSPSVTPDTRLPCYVGRGSRFAVAKNQTVRRAFLYDQALTFPSNAPFLATLPFTATNDQSLARIVKADGTEVKLNQWSFVLNGQTGKYDQVQINSEVFDPVTTYTISYQSDDRNVLDPYPVDDIREFVAVGDSPDADDYVERDNYFANFTVSNAVVADNDPLGLHPDTANTNKTPSVSALNTTGVSGTSTMVFSGSSAYAHNYSRFYTVTCIAKAGVSPNRTATFEWSAQPVSAGNSNLPATPIHPSLTKPTISIDEAVPASLTQNLELGLQMTFAFGAPGNHYSTAPADVWTFNGWGPARMEIDPRLANDNQYVEAGTVTKTAGTGFATLSYDTTSNPNPTWNALYRVQCTAAGDTSTKSALTIDDGGGNGVVLTAKVGGVAGDAITVALIDPAQANYPLTVGVNGNIVTITLGTNNAGTLISTYTQIAAAVTATTASPVSAATAGIGATVAAAAPSAPLIGGADGVFTATVAWAEYGERVGVYGLNSSLTYTQATPLTAVRTVTLSNGVVLDVRFPSGPLAVGDIFEFEVKAPRQFYMAKDNRNVILTTATATNAGGAGYGEVTGDYVTDTLEGAFGSFSAVDNAYVPSASQWLHGALTLPGNLLLLARNLHGGPTTSTVAGSNRHAATNKFSFSATLAGTIDWSLVSQTSETFMGSQVLTDVLGVKTGTPATPYIILQNVPDSVTSVNVDASPVSYTLHQDVNGNNTQYISFVTRPGSTSEIVVSYIYRGAEPTPGQIYYVTSKHVRPAEFYNTPILVTSVQDGRSLLAPAETTNHLYIMNEIAMGDCKAPGMYIVQVLDADGDDFLTDLDYKDAITASEAPRAITDLVVLSHFSSLADQLASLNRMSDPFKRRFRLGWFGAADGTEVGSTDIPGSLIALARRDLQVYGDNPAHGTRILVGSTSATRDLRLENGVVTEVTLDGSFIAGAMAALTASFSDPASTLLRRTLPGFKTIETHGDIESPTNLLLGANNIVFITEQGAGTFRMEEDVTVDTFAPDFNLINNMVQKMFVNKNIRDQLDEKIIAMVVPSAEAGVGLIRGFLIGALIGLLGRGLIGAYQNADGSERAIDPTKDVIVRRDATDPTLYHILYAFFTKNEIKRIFGLYSVNTNDFGSGR